MQEYRDEIAGQLVDGHGTLLVVLPKAGTFHRRGNQTRVDGESTLLQPRAHLRLQRAGIAAVGRPCLFVVTAQRGHIPVAGFGDRSRRSAANGIDQTLVDVADRIHVQWRRSPSQGDHRNASKAGEPVEQVAARRVRDLAEQHHIGAHVLKHVVHVAADHLERERPLPRVPVVALAVHEKLEVVLGRRRRRRRTRTRKPIGDRARVDVDTQSTHLRSVLIESIRVEKPRDGVDSAAAHRRHRLIQSERRVVEPEAERTHGDPLSADRRDPVEVFGRDDPAGGEHRPVPAG